jgi:aspartate-semialdehyde dehydrogenase
MKPFTCAIVGATGMVGGMFLKVIAERKLPVSALYLFASARSAGFQIPDGKGNNLTVEELTPASFDRGIGAALFAAGNEVSRRYAPIAARKGCVAVDNSSAWRMEPEVPLVVPEVNSGDILRHRGIIANPNCCAAPAALALYPLHKAYGVKRLVISTYQSVSGAGAGGWQDLDRTLDGKPPQHFPYPIAHNILPHIGAFNEDGYTGEEQKLMDEIRKILNAPDIKATATTVRVPVYTGHSLSVNVTFEKPYDLSEAKELLANQPGAVLADDPEKNLYPMPLTAAGTDTVHIGRIRRDDSCENSLNMWVSADNLRKGAATNAVQILEKVMGLEACGDTGMCTG